MNAASNNFDTESQTCPCDFHQIIDEVQRRIEALSPEELEARCARRARLRFEAALYLLHGQSAADRQLAAAYLMRLEGSP